MGVCVCVYVCVWLMATAHLGLKVKVIGQGQCPEHMGVLMQ